MTTAFIYIRFSSAKQEKGASRERQREIGERLCADKEWEIAEVIEDLGVSAWKGDHLKVGHLGRFAERVRSGAIPAGSVLVVENIDRLSRQHPRKTQRWIEDITEQGLRIATPTRLYDDASLKSPAAIGELFELLINAYAANRLSETISGRVGDSWNRRRKAALRGQIASRHAPGWLEVIGEGPSRYFKPIPERAATVVQIYQWAADGHGSRTIARMLNEASIAPWGSHQHAKSTRVGWEHTYVADILKSPAVEGDWHTGRGSNDREKKGEVIHGYFGKALVDAALVAKARAAVEARKGTGGSKRAAYSNLFMGLSRCYHCEGKMGLYSNSKRANSYMGCINAQCGRCPQKTMFSYKRFEPVALDAVLHLAMDESHFQAPDQTLALKSKVASLAKSILDKQVDADRAAELVMRTASPTIERKLVALETNLAALRAELSVAEGQLKEATARLSPAEHMRRVMEVREALDHTDHTIRVAARQRVHEAMKSMVDQVTFLKTDQGDRFIQIKLAGGLHSLIMNNDGAVVQRNVPSPTAKAADYIDYVANDVTMVAKVETYFRRRG